MKKIVCRLLCLSLSLGLYSCSENDDYKIGDYTQKEGYYPFLVNKGALVRNKRPHSGKNFQVQLNYYSKTQVNKITLLGKVIAGPRLPSSDRYTDLSPIESFSGEQIREKGGFSESAKVDTLVFNWQIPAEIENDGGYVYYTIAVENVNMLADTTSGDYWKVVEEDSNAMLNQLLVNGELIDGFNKEIHDYQIVLSAETTKIPIVKAIPTSIAVNEIVITNAINLTGTLEERTTTVKVIAEDGVTTLNYRIVFTVAAS